jgi:predicted nucleotidyltransferase
MIMTLIKEKALNLTEAEKLALDEVLAVLRTDWPLVKFKLFGSKVSGTFDAESDLDILVMLPCPVTNDIRRQIVHNVSDINFAFGTNISALIVSEEEWQKAPLSLLPIHAFIEEEGVSL